ncbi:hypothetical protein EV368DRAFT_84492 [Lentinula lateritia]|uniref:Uncharacterized protein n=1 Tax=Lentinula aff. lateritia TaxID=2804960 RepID=A0ACC1TVD3_9AGAR|nr:hypothetical protein F5876DRAFT_78452 [Lentinula aff. lateritia]KAJ3850495.1 hypothetical protein EV368DRAFT_84492 [Lentinula lateritia]
MLARTGFVARQRFLVPLSRQRNASTSPTDHHDHHHIEEDTTVYPKEGKSAIRPDYARFATPAWRRFFVLSIIIGAAYQFAPEPSEAAFVTRWLAMYTTTSEKWLDMNVRHTVLSKEVAEGVNLFTTATRPPINRMRFPQMMDNASPFNVQVGLNADTRDFVAKTEHEV